MQSDPPASLPEPTPTPVPAIRARGLTKVYTRGRAETVRALRGLDLECRPGEIYGLLGPNGAGKTTTLRILSTILRPTAGTAEVAGVDVGADPLEARRRIGFLSGTTGLYPRLTGRETLTYFGRLNGFSGGELEARVEAMIAAFDMAAFADRRCGALSTGQRQRVSIARAVLHGPEVLILDEPTTGLDILAAGTMIDFVESRREAGTCVLFSTHVLSEAERLCDRIGVLFDGRLLASGTYDELARATGERWLEDIFRTLVRTGTDG